VSSVAKNNRSHMLGMDGRHSTGESLKRWGWCDWTLAEYWAWNNQMSLVHVRCWWYIAT